MQLPYPVNPPTWTSYGFHSLNTRPFLALHRRKYRNIYRLFPASQHAQQLSPPISPLPFNDAQQEDDAFSASSHDTQLGDHHEQLEGAQQVEHFACPAALHTRNLQRYSWQNSGRHPCAAPVYFPENVLQREIEDNSERFHSQTAPLPTTFSQCDKDHSPSSFEPTFGNPLAAVKICDENAFVCSLSGYVSAVSVYQIRNVRDDDGNITQSLLPRGTQDATDNTPYDPNPIRHTVVTNMEHQAGDAAKLVAMTKSSLNFATVSTDKAGPSISWIDSIPLSRVYSCAFNPMYSEEVAILSEEGLFHGPLSTLHQLQDSHLSSVGATFHDIQVLDSKQQLTTVFYGAHPRTLLLSSRRRIISHDLRMKYRQTSKTVLFDTSKDRGLPKYDTGIAAFHPVETRSHQVLLATQSKLNYIDLRMPHSPLLDWSLTLPLPIDHMCVTNLRTPQQPKSDVIALVSRKQNFLQVFHGLHVDHQEPRTEIWAKDSMPLYPATTVAKPAVQWSDLPWCHLTKLKPVSKIAGIALVPRDDHSGVSLVQWSATEGLISQALNAEATEEDKVVYNEGRNQLAAIDNVTNMMNFRTALRESGDLEARNMARPVTDTDTGSALQLKTRRIFAQDAFGLRERICRSEEDDVSADGALRLPRVFMGDLPNIQRLRAGELGRNNAKHTNRRKRKRSEFEDDMDSDDGMKAGSLDGMEDIHEMSDGEGVGMGSLMDELQVAKSLDEMARHVRSGMPHNSTPLGYSGLVDTIESSPFVEPYDVEWHGGCKAKHENCAGAVSTDEKLPDWVSTRMYVANGVSRGEALADADIALSSEYGMFLSRMKYEFFHEQVPDDLQIEKEVDIERVTSLEGSQVDGTMDNELDIKV